MTGRHGQGGASVGGSVPTAVAVSDKGGSIGVIATGAHSVSAVVDQSTSIGDLVRDVDQSGFVAEDNLSRLGKFGQGHNPGNTQ